MPRLQKEARTAQGPRRRARRRRGGAEGARRRARRVFAAGLDLEPLRELHLLTAKPFLYVFNVDEAELGDDDLQGRAARPRRAGRGDLPRRQDRGRARPSSTTTRRSSCCSRSARTSRACASWPGSASTRSACRPTSPPGPKEARAWTIHKGATAPEAAGVIHTDFQRGFIKAEVVSFDDLVDAGSMAEAKAARQGPHGGQGLRHGRRRRRGVPLQRLRRAISAGQRHGGCSRLIKVAHEVEHFVREGSRNATAHVLRVGPKMRVRAQRLFALACPRACCTFTTYVPVLGVAAECDRMSRRFVTLRTWPTQALAAIPGRLRVTRSVDRALRGDRSAQDASSPTAGEGQPLATVLHTVLRVAPRQKRPSAMDRRWNAYDRTATRDG